MIAHWSCPLPTPMKLGLWLHRSFFIAHSGRPSALSLLSSLFSLCYKHRYPLLLHYYLLLHLLSLSCLPHTNWTRRRVCSSAIVMSWMSPPSPLFLPNCLPSSYIHWTEQNCIPSFSLSLICGLLFEVIFAQTPPNPPSCVSYSFSKEEQGSVLLLA